MARAPITYREHMYAPVRGTGNPPLLRRLEFNYVETELGTMAETVSYQLGFGGNQDKMTPIDMDDRGVNKVTVLEEQEFQNRFFTGGNSWLWETRLA